MDVHTNTLVALTLTSADQIPAEAVSEVVEHTVAVLLQRRKQILEGI